MVILPTAYLGNMAYYAALLNSECYQIDLFESYTKQSFRSRCEILSANGRQTLSIPVVRKKGEKPIVRDAEIEYVMPWQKQHWRSIVSSYASSPFFAEYEADFVHIFERKVKYLADFNAQLNEIVLNCLDVDIKGWLTTDFISDSEYERSGVLSLRETLSDKKNSDSIVFEPYYQVFSDKLEFQNNLSVIDCIFCEGGSSTRDYLLK